MEVKLSQVEADVTVLVSTVQIQFLQHLGQAADVALKSRVVFQDRLVYPASQDEVQSDVTLEHQIHRIHDLSLGGQLFAKGMFAIQRFGKYLPNHLETV
jgi:hypothetical protein